MDKVNKEKKYSFRIRPDIAAEAKALIEIVNRDCKEGDVRINMTTLVEYSLVAFMRRLKNRMQESGLIRVVEDEKTES